MTWLGNPAHGRWLEGETDRLLAFGAKSLSPRGFGYLGDDGRILPGRGTELWITCRMTHCFALGHLLGRPGMAELADHGLAAIAGPFADPVHGGWFAALPGDGDRDGDEAPPGEAGQVKAAYPHAFVVLAAASATCAGRPGARALLDEALAIQERYFWDEDAGMVREEWDRAFDRCGTYRGVNANMHMVEAYLSAAGATGERVWLERAGRIAARVVTCFAAGNDWRIPEHFDENWRPDLGYNRERPADPFRPYGATIGHAFEWARLALHVEAGLGPDAPGGLADGAARLFALAVREGWGADGAPGFIYTTGWDGKPITRERMHWVTCEAIAAAAALHRATGQGRYEEYYEQWWGYAARQLIDPAGSWHHELDAAGRPAGRVWPGKPDIYHAVQASLIPRLPLAPALAPALAGGLLDT